MDGSNFYIERPEPENADGEVPASVGSAAMISLIMVLVWLVAVTELPLGTLIAGPPEPGMSFLGP